MKNLLISISYLFGSSVTGFFGLGVAAIAAVPKQSPTCQAPALSRLVRHRVAAGETLERIAQQYNLLPTTLMGFNPVLRQGSAPVGTEILIPPYNGIRVNVPSGSSWRDIAKQYNVRADALYEVNGCQAAPSVVFVPGVNWSPVAGATAASVSNASASNPISRYPLPEVGSILLAYGWQVNPTTNAVEFHSGINLAAQPGTPVLAVGSGTVAFAGTQGSSKTVVLNHAQGLQTRYSQLETLAVKVGQAVQSGTQIGSVAATATPYLHFEVRSNSPLGWVAQDPGTYIRELKMATPSRR